MRKVGVTGGLGKALAKELITKYNANVIGIARNAEKMQKLECEISSKNFTSYLFDVSKNANWIDFASKMAQKSQKIDILINNAGVMPKFSRFESLDISVQENVIQTNLFSAVYSVYNLLPILKQSPCGGIVNIASACAFAAVIGTSMYSASKAALKGFTDSIREENKNLYIAGVYPGFIKTELFRDGGLTKRMEKFASEPEKVATKILNKIHRKKKHIVVGADGKALSIFSKIMPKTITPIISNFLTGSGEENFKGLQNGKK